MKKRIKIMSLFLALLLLSTVLIACKKKNGDETGSVNTDNAQSGQYANELDARDFGQAEFVIYDANDHADMHVNFATESTGDAVQEALYKRDLYLKGRNNVQISYFAMEASDDVTVTIRNLFAAGDREYDIVVSTASGGRLATLSSEGLFTNLNDIPTVNLEEKWWSSWINKQLSLGGKTYFTTGDIMASVYQAPMVVYANRDLLEENQLSTADDLYQTVRDGEWTLDYMCELSKGLDRDVNEDGVMHANDDFFGTAAQPNRMTTIGMLVGSNFDMSYIVGNNIVVNDDIVEIEKRTDIMKKFMTEITVDNFEFNDIINKTFKQDRAVFLVHLVEAATQGLREMDTDFIVLPMPKGSDTQESYRSAVNGWVNCFIAVPIYDAADSKYSEDIGYLLEAMARASYDIVRPVAFDNVVMLRSIKDPASAEMLEIVFNSLYLDYQSIYDFGGAATLMGKHLFSGANLSSSLSGVKTKMTEEAAKLSSSWLSNGTVN